MDEGFGIWYYKPFKVIDKKTGTIYYCIKEFYPTEKGKGGWTEKPCYPCGDTMEELIGDLEMMLYGAQQYEPQEEEE